MMKHYDILTTLIITLSLLLGSANAVAFDLFNPDRGKPPPPPASETPVKKPKSTSLPNPFRALPMKPQEQVPTKLLRQKDFTLLGTSRIGKKRAVVLKGPDNKEFVLRFKNNTRTLIKNYEKEYEGYYLLDVKAREVQIEYPANAPCRKSNEQKGVECNDADEGKTVILSLMQHKSISSPPKLRPKTTANKKDKKKDKKKREEARKKRQERYKNFKKKVIKDEDVPPGMRVVHTPFGDRLVPIK